MNGLAAMAESLGPGLLAATLVAPLLVLAAYLSSRLQSFSLAMAPLAPLPAVVAAILAIGGEPFGFELRALRVSLWLDVPAAMLLAAAALVWMIVSAFALADTAGKPNAARFTVCWLLTLVGSLGVFIAADLLTFYLVYALVSVPAYYLIANDEAAGQRRASGVYMAFTLLGEAVLLVGFALLAAGEPGGSLNIRDVVAALPTSPWRDAALASLILGFGMKIALAPLHGWMPLTYTAAPIPAAAVLSGAAVKTGVIGLIRFLPLGDAFPDWGEALAGLGFITAFYGVLVGITQQNPKTMLAYSSISQMGVIAAVLGVGLAGADQSVAQDAAFYAANHVLVKAALFLTVGAVAVAGERNRSLSLIVAAVLALSLGGLPLTGGALAKLAVKEPLGTGLASAAAKASAAGTTILMLCFLMRLARWRDSGAGASPNHPWSWLMLAVASVVVPWLMFATVGGGLAGVFAPTELWDALWPMLIGGVLAAGVWTWRDSLPRIPAGDIVVGQEVAFRTSLGLGAAFERLDTGFRQWPAAALSLLTVALVLAAAAFAGH